MPERARIASTVTCRVSAEHYADFTLHLLPHLVGNAHGIDEFLNSEDPSTKAPFVELEAAGELPASGSLERHHFQVQYNLLIPES